MKNFLKEGEAPASAGLSWPESFNCCKSTLQIQYSCRLSASGGSFEFGSEGALENLEWVLKEGGVFLHLIYCSIYFCISLFSKLPINSGSRITIDFVVQRCFFICWNFWNLNQMAEACFFWKEKDGFASSYWPGCRSRHRRVFSRKFLYFSLWLGFNFELKRHHSSFEKLIFFTDLKF